MAFLKKVWKNRLSEYPTRRSLTNVETQEVTIVDVARVEGEVAQEGDPFNESSMNDLEERIADCIGDTDISGIGDGTVSGAIDALNTDLTKLPLNLLYPVGAVYCTTATTNPSAIFGGTWTRIATSFQSGAVSRFTWQSSDNYLWAFKPQPTTVTVYFWKRTA